MRRPGKRLPSLRLHKPSHRAVVTLDGRDFYLGPYGSEESKAEYDRMIAEWLANNRQLPASARSSQPATTHLDGMTVSELLLRYWRFAEEHYQRDGKATRHLQNLKDAVRPVRTLYGHSEAAMFGPSALKTVRKAMIDSGLARRTIANRIGKIRQMFRWAVENELVPPSVYHALMAVSGLRRGRDGVRETPPIRPVTIEEIEATIPFMNAQVAGLVRIQLLTGMRPGEAVAMKADEIDRSGKVWIYRPSRHKTEGYDRVRAIPIGPKAQKVLRPFLETATGSSQLFSPRVAVETRNAKRKASRTTPMTPSQRQRKKAKAPKRPPGAIYSRCAYRSAVWRACDKAFPHPKLSAIAAENLTEAQSAELKEWRKSHRWHPNRLRHTAATIIRSKYGLEAAQAVLGHAKADVTQIYAERDLSRANDVMSEIG